MRLAPPAGHARLCRVAPRSAGRAADPKAPRRPPARLPAARRPSPETSKGVKAVLAGQGSLEHQLRELRKEQRERDERYAADLRRAMEVAQGAQRLLAQRNEEVNALQQLLALQNLDSRRQPDVLRGHGLRLSQGSPGKQAQPPLPTTKEGGQRSRNAPAAARPGAGQGKRRAAAAAAAQGQGDAATCRAGPRETRSMARARAGTEAPAAAAPGASAGAVSSASVSSGGSGEAAACRLSVLRWEADEAAGPPAPSVALQGEAALLSAVEVRQGGRLLFVDADFGRAVGAYAVRLRLRACASALPAGCRSWENPRLSPALQMPPWPALRHLHGAARPGCCRHSHRCRPPLPPGPQPQGASSIKKLRLQAEFDIHFVRPATAAASSGIFWLPAQLCLLPLLPPPRVGAGAGAARSPFPALPAGCHIPPARGRAAAVGQERQHHAAR